MAIQNINELYDRLSQDEIFSSSGLNSAEELKGYLEKLPDENKQSFYDAFLQDEDINFDQFNNLLKKKEQGRTGILSSALGSIDLGSPSGSKITEPQTVTPEVKAPEVTPIAETTTAPPIAEEEMGIEDFSVSGVEGGPLDGGPGKPKPKVFKPDFRTKSQIAAELGTQKEAERTPVKQTPEVIKKVREKAIEVKKAVEKEQTENPFKNAGFEFEVATGREIMDESGTRKEFQTVTKQPTDAEIGEVLLKNTQIPLANGVDVGRIFGRPTYVFDRETYTSYLERKGFSPEKINELQNYYIDQYIKANSEQDVETKLGRVEGKDINEKLTKIRQQEDEKGLNLLAGQYGIDVADKARELQSFMAKRKRLGEAGYDQWNRQMQTLQKEMSTLVGGGERLYNPEDGKLYDAETAPKRAVAFKVALDKAIKLYGNTDIDKLKQIRSTLYDQVEFLEKEYDRMVGPQWRGKEFLKGLSGTITEEQKEGLIQTFSRLDNLKAQLSAVNARILTNTDIEPTTTEKTGQFLKQLRAGLPGGDFASKYQTLKDDYNAYVQGIEGEIKLKEGEAEKGELTFGEQLVGGLGSTIPIMAELALTRKITPSAAFLRGSGYLRPITRGVLKTTGSTKFANFMTDAIANAVQGYTSYGLTSETGATGVGETLFSQTIWDKIGLEKMGAKWAPVLRYLSKTALGTTGETIEEFVGEFSNNLSETGFDWSKSAEETFGKDISDFGKKLALYASTSALLSGLYNAPELAIKSLRIDEVISEAENKLNDPNLSQADKEAIKSSVEMMKKTKDQLTSKQTDLAEPVSTIGEIKPGEEMEAPGGVTPPVAEGEEAAAFEQGEGPIEPTQPVGPQPVVAEEVNKQLAKEGINDVSLQRVEEYGKEIESGNADFERFSPSEQRGLIEGGPVHVAATIITGKSDRAADTQDDSNDRQEEVVKEYAQKKGVWTENAPAKLKEKYGDPFQSGKESLVWLDEERGVVVKSSVTNQYPTLREALDSITLSNAYFPAAKITVVGFGTNKDGDFEIITEQPYIQGEDATEQDIKDYFNKLGFTENERLYQGKDAFGNEEVIFKDAAPKNVIKTPEGNIVPIDLIAKINKPELNANGTRTVPSTVAEEVTEAAPEAVGAQTKVTEQAPEVTETKAEAPKEYGAQNKIVTKQDYDQAVKNLRNPNIPSGFDFSKIGDLVKAAMYHIEAGSRKFADFTKKMVEQFGRGVKQYLPNVFRRANTQLQQQQVAAPTPAPAAPVVKTSAQIKQEINQAYNDYTAQNPNATPEQIGAHLEAKGYSIGQIKRFIPQLEEYIKKESVRKFEDFVKNFQDKISKRRAEIEKFMESNPGLDYAQVYQQLKDQYSDFELFKMFYEDGADTDVLDELFGTEYRQTIQRAIDSKNYNPDFIREIDDDIRSRKTLKNLGEANSIFTELQDFATAEQLVEAAADVFEMSGVEEAMKTVTDKVRAQNRNNLENFQKMLKGEEMTEEQILSMTSLLSFSGRILRMGRGLFMTQKGLTDLIIKNLETATLRESQLFTKKKKLFKVTEEQRKKIEAGVKKYLETKTEFEKATKDLEEGANALTDPKFEAFDKAKAEHEKAARELKDYINKLYGSRKPLFSRFITSMTSMALLSFRTIFIGIPSNIEQMLANMPRRGIGKVLGWTRILADKMVGAQIAAKAMGGKVPLAAEALKRGTGVSVDPSLYRKMAAQRGWEQIKAIVFKGVSQSTVSEKNFLEGGAEIDGVRDFKMSYRMIAKLIESFLPNKKSFTDEEWADAFDKVLVAMEQKDANGKPVLALQHSQGYDTIATFFRGLFGVLPTITGRAIALSGDRYFQQLGMYEFLASYANSMGITDPVEVQRFIRLNSIGSGELRKAAEKAGNRRIFATDNQVVNWFGKMMGGFEKKEEEIYNRKLKQYSKGKKTAAMVQNLNAVPSVAKRIALNINAPFVRIPTNALAKYFRITSTPTTLILAVGAQMKLSQEMRNYQENYSLDKNATMSESKKKKMEADRVKLFEQQRLAAQYWTEFFQGLQLLGIGLLLLKAGAIGAPYGDDDEAKKRARAAGIAQQDPAKINISQLVRSLMGETRGQTMQKGDITFDYRNLGMLGFALSAICSGESFYRVQKAKQEKVLGTEEDLAGMIGFQMVAESLSNGATQLSFIQNIATLATAAKGDFGKAFKDYMTGITTTALTVPTLSYGIFSPVERIKGISADPFRNFNPDLEANEVFSGEITARVWTKLTSRSPLFGFGIRVSDEPDSDFVAPLEVFGLKPSEFYRPQIGPHKEELYKKSTLWDTRSGSASDKFLAFLQASVDPFSFSDYEGFVSNVKPFDKNKEYRKGDYFEYDNSVYVALTNKKAGVEFSRGKIDKDFQYVDKKTNFVNPERFKNNKIGSEKTATLFDLVNIYEQATGDRKNYDIFSRIYSDPVTFKDNKGTYALYVSSEDQRKLQKMRGQVLVDAWSTSEANSLMEGWKKMADNPNISDEEYNETVKNEFLDWMLGPLDTEGNRSGGVKSSINEALNALESDPGFDEVKKNAVLNTVKSGRLTVENFKRLLENTEAYGYLNSLRDPDKKKKTVIKLRDGEYVFE